MPVADSQQMEALARIEHKLDQVLEFLHTVVSAKFDLTPVGDPRHQCPLCGVPVSYLVDILSQVVTRKCGCSTGKIAPIDLSAFAPPAIPAKTGDGNGNRDEEDGSGSR